MFRLGEVSDEPPDSGGRYYTERVPTWLAAILMGSLVVCSLLLRFGSYQESIRVQGYVTAAGNNTSRSRVGVFSVRLFIPPESIDVVFPGQLVWVAIDAFPFHFYGERTATLEDVARVAQLPSHHYFDGIPPRGSVYLGRAVLNPVGSHGTGSSRPLVHGMSVTARIETRRVGL